MHILVRYNSPNSKTSIYSGQVKQDKKLETNYKLSFSFANRDYYNTSLT